MDSPGQTWGRKAMERFGGHGSVAVPWSWQIWSALLQQLRVLLEFVYYSVWTVFQICRLEVHFRIMDELAGHRVQHLSADGNPGQSFIISSSYNSNTGVLVSGSGPLCANGADRAGKRDLSSLQAEDLCRSLVDDFVFRAAGCFDSGPADSDVPREATSSWELKHPSFWEACEFLEKNTMDEVCTESPEDEPLEVTSDDLMKSLPDCKPITVQDSFWDDDDEDADSSCEEFKSEDSQALWESFTKSKDPYNTFSFSACLSSCSQKESVQSAPHTLKHKDEQRDSSSAGDTEGESQNKSLRMYCLGRSWTDSDSDWESSSEASEGDLEENEKLWESFNNPSDPYNLLHFTACPVASSPKKTSQEGQKKCSGRAKQDRNCSEIESLSSDSVFESPSLWQDIDLEERQHSEDLSSDSEQNDDLWKSFSQSADPYHPLHFRACLESSPTARKKSIHLKNEESTANISQKVTCSKPVLPKRHFKHYCPKSLQVTIWKKSSNVVPEGVQKKDEKQMKKVSFSPVVQVHVMHAWSFASRAARRGPWEEMARDRVRFRRRIQDMEQAIGYCFSTAHRGKMQDYLSHKCRTPPAVVA
ncbi:protein phosphatase 1 regulatory subunit 15A [Amia ocellicauda]|uniref:protein phosphatase 1 regulatory subunit 15A n=1 Tax=Amia ocellicauda TaxID=2972642 RepID=UPI003463D05E|nr:PR15B phosphatase [Amia calva]